MTTRWVYLFRGPWARGVVKHSISVAACLLALYTQTLFRVPSRFVFLLIPYVSAALVFLSVVFLVNHLLRGVREDDPARRVFRIAEQVSDVCVRVFVLYSVLLFANATLDRTTSEPREADVVELAGDSLDLGHVPFRWIALRPVADPGRMERVLRSPLDPPLWAGEPVLLDVRAGFFHLPWIARIAPDDVRQGRAILERNPTSAQGWKTLIKGYALRDKVAEGTDATVEYARLYPADYDFPENIAKGLGMAGHCPEMYRILEPFIARRTDYEFYWLVGHALAIFGKLLHFLSGRLSGLSGLSRAGRPLFQPLDAIGLLFFLTGQAIGLSRHRPETVGGFLRLHSAEQVACFAKALGGQTRVGRTPRIGRRAAHLVLCLAQAVECLLSRLLRAPRALVAGRLRSARLP